MIHNVGMSMAALSLIFSLSYEIWLEEDFLEDSDDALKEWYEYNQEPITIDNLIKKPINEH